MCTHFGVTSISHFSAKEQNHGTGIPHKLKPEVLVKLSAMVFSTLVLIMDTMNEETNIVNRTENVFKIPTGWRLTSWLLTRHGGVVFGTHNTNPLSGRI